MSMTPLVGFVPNKNKNTGAGDYVYQINEPVDVAQQMCFLGSSSASFMNGEILIIDGGHSITTNGH